MWYKCKDCGRVFEDGDEKRWFEDSGEPMVGCPSCGGAYDEAVRCPVCYGFFLEEELYIGMCEDCGDEKASEYKYDFSSCFEIGKMDEKETVKVNSFLAYMYTEQQIEEILFRDLAQSSAFQPIDCSGYINSDKSWFLEHILKLEKEKKE